MTPNASGLTIRSATMDDAERLREIGSRIFVDTFGEANTPENMAAYLAESFSIEKIKSELADASSTTFISEQDADAVGYARLRAGAAPKEVTGSPIELVRLYVDAAYHGRGVAAALMDRCIEVAGQGGHDVIWLGVWEHNPRAQAFYRKYGFEQVGAQEFHLGDDIQRDWVMARPV